MESIKKSLFTLEDKKYGDFQFKLLPGIRRETIIGVRVPNIKKLALEIVKNGKAEEFLQHLPHEYYDENMLHSVLLSKEKNFDRCIKAIDAFLPFVDNWAVCDTLSPKVFNKNKKVLLEKVKKWIFSQKTYTCRFGIKTLMNCFLDEDFKEEYLLLPSKIKSEEYYVNMMIAWYYATALAKQYKSAIGIIESNCLPVWVHNKTIQKAVESYRISTEQKGYLKALKR